MKLHLATDHAGFHHKELLKAHLIEQGHEVVDHGNTVLDQHDDYPDFVTPCAQAVATDQESMAIIFGGSGEGEAMCANRVPDIRAIVYYGGTPDILTFSREHNNANVLSIGARFMSPEQTLTAVDIWLSVPFTSDERHVRRLGKF